jgi:hypothetical protein
MWQDLEVRIQAEQTQLICPVIAWLSSAKPSDQRERGNLISEAFEINKLLMRLLRRFITSSQ